MYSRGSLSHRSFGAACSCVKRLVQKPICEERNIYDFRFEKLLLQFALFDRKKARNRSRLLLLSPKKSWFCLGFSFGWPPRRPRRPSFASCPILKPSEMSLRRFLGGVFGLRLTFGDSYPAKPPRVRFTSEVFHPNVFHARAISIFYEVLMLMVREWNYKKLRTMEPIQSPVETGRMCICTLLQLGHFVASLGSTLSLHTTYFTVYIDGTLCIDIIQDAWSPCHNVCTILMSIQSLLTDPNPASPANPEAAQLFQHDNQAYNKRVRRCARVSIEL
ncbi:hypothetical protein ZIOFF_002521 [Zingiber officinale]|uniref:UBC core domain-containing protein n=1 Tax=Zingiber officinale TaxID=94328 RepID=A0A8J5HX13_ZINOF|nr:hypothetical protein ZIOFF_002521 [Zingiber officinale]